MEINDIIRAIAKEDGVTPEEVYRDMQACINEAYSRVPQGSPAKHKQNSVPRKGEIPTPEELIEYVVEEMRRMEREKLR